MNIRYLSYCIDTKLRYLLYCIDNKVFRNRLAKEPNAINVRLDQNFEKQIEPIMYEITPPHIFVKNNLTLKIKAPQSVFVFEEGNALNRQTKQFNEGGIGERDDAKIMRRPLDLWGLDKMAEKIYDPAHHEQIFFEDERGGNIGFFSKGFKSETDPNIIRLYRDKDDNHYDDNTMRRAVENVQWNMGSYKLRGNNCQDFTRLVINEYYRILEEQVGILPSSRDLLFPSVEFYLKMKQK